MTGGLDGSTSGAGTIRFRGDEVEQVDIDGNGRDGRFRLEFRAGDRPTPPGGDGSNGSFTEEYGYDQPGADLRDLRVDELRSCQDACARDSRCRAYTFNTRDRRCYLKSEERPMIRRTDCVTGVRRGGGGGGGGLTQRDGYNLEGGDYTSVYQRSAGGVPGRLPPRSRLPRLHLQSARRMCYLKDRVGNYISAPRHGERREARTTERRRGQEAARRCRARARPSRAAQRQEAHAVGARGSGKAARTSGRAPSTAGPEPWQPGPPRARRLAAGAARRRSSPAPASRTGRRSASPRRPGPR